MSDYEDEDRPEQRISAQSPDGQYEATQGTGGGERNAMRGGEKPRKTKRESNPGHYSIDGGAETGETIMAQDLSVQGVPVMGYGYGMNGGNGGFFDNGGGILAGLLLGGLLGNGGFGWGGNRNQGDCATVDQLAVATLSDIAVQGYNQLVNGQQTILQAINSDTRDNLLATCNLGTQLSNQICEEGRSTMQGQSALSTQMAEAFAANQIARAQDKFDLSNLIFNQTLNTNNQFAEVKAQACANFNALQQQISNCCCELKEEIRAVNTARIQDELDALRLEKATNAATAGQGNTINQIAMSLGAVTQTLAALQAKVNGQATVV